MALPALRGVGAAVTGTAGFTPPFPVGYTAIADDVAITICECSSGDTITAPSGWTQAAAVTVTTGEALKLTAVGRRLQAGDTAPAYADPGNHVQARMIVWSGCRTTGLAWQGAVGSQDLTASTSVSIAGITTADNDCMLMYAVGTGQDGLNITTGVSGWTNASLANLAEQMDGWTASGLGGGFAMASGEKATAGPSGTMTATLGGGLIANVKAYLVIPLIGATAAAESNRWTRGYPVGMRWNRAASIAANY